MKGSSLTVNALSHQSDVYLQSVRCKSIAYINYSELYVDLTSTKRYKAAEKI
ncbi:MAG: hypothetical protein ACJA0I_001028 [Gammaproteobacteria bacterium]|jgi:hypothetical protein